MEVGIDLVKISRFNNHEKFANKFLSDEEFKEYLNAFNKPQYVASRFCLKEAFVKSQKKGILDFNLKDIKVIKEFEGSIHIEYFEKKCKASLSHEDEYCVGVVIDDWYVFRSKFS